MITDLLLCLVVLIAQLGVLHYLDKRVAAMPRLSDIASQREEASMADPETLDA